MFFRVDDEIRSDLAAITCANAGDTYGAVVTTSRPNESDDTDVGANVDPRLGIDSTPERRLEHRPAGAD